MLEAALELLDLPLGLLLGLFVLSYLTLDTFRDLKRHSRSLTGNREFDQNLGCKVVSWESGPNLEGELKLILRHFIYEGVDPERCLIVTVDTVVHDQELTIRRVDDQRFHGLKVSQIHAFMEVAIIKYY